MAVPLEPAAPLATSGSSEGPASTGSADAPAPSETVERPPPGLARGRWEAPPWAFVLVAAATLLGGLAWLVVALRTRRSPR